MFISVYFVIRFVVLAFINSFSSPQPTYGFKESYVQVSMRTVVGVGIFIFVLMMWGAGSAWFFLCRDDLVARVLSKQADVQYEYESQISSMRAQVDRIASRQLLSQDSFEGRVEQVFSRQAQLESRHALVVSLAEGVGTSLGDLTGSIAKKSPVNPPFQIGIQGSVSPVSSSIAPISQGSVSPRAAKPKPKPEAIHEEIGAGRSATPDVDKPVLRGGTRALLPEHIIEQGVQEHPLEHPLAVGGPYVPADKSVVEKIRLVEQSLVQIETVQISALSSLYQKAVDASQYWRGAIAELGLNIETLNQQIGKNLEKKGERASRDHKNNLFDVQLQTVRPLIAVASALRKTFLSLPVKRPLSTDHDITSPFGHRSDPFTRGLAMHSGIDFRGDAGTPVRAAAGGVVTQAQLSGGYGNLVEIQHENGVSTRYAHLSFYDVVEGQKITVGQVIGRIGSTGRSTAPHLHYEVRINGEAVDPMRFLRAGSRMVSR